MLLSLKITLLILIFRYLLTAVPLSVTLLQRMVSVSEVILLYGTARHLHGSSSRDSMLMATGLTQILWISVWKATLKICLMHMLNSILTLTSMLTTYVTKLSTTVLLLRAA